MRRGAVALALALVFTAAPVGAEESHTAPLRSFTVAAAGYIAIQQGIWEAAASHAPGPGVDDFSALLSPVEPCISGADPAFCHLEVPLSLARDGDDAVWSGDGDDLTCLGDGDDPLSGYGRDDLLIGGRGDDALWGGSGDDHASGGNGRDECRGVAGSDTCEA